MRMPLGPAAFDGSTFFNDADGGEITSASQVVTVPAYTTYLPMPLADRAAMFVAPPPAAMLATRITASVAFQQYAVGAPPPALTASPVVNLPPGGTARFYAAYI